MRKTSVSQYFHLKLSLLIFTLQWLFLFLDETKRDLGNSWNIFFRSKTKTLKIEEEKSSRKNKNCKAKPPQSYRILLGIPRLLSSLLFSSSSSRQFKLQCCKIDGRVVSERRRRSTRRSAEKKNVKFIMKRRRKSSSTSRTRRHQKMIFTKHLNSRRRELLREMKSHSTSSRWEEARGREEQIFFALLISFFFFANVRSNQSPTIWP